MPTVKVNDINMYYEIHGEGEPLLMIQGMGGDLSTLGFDKKKPKNYLWVVFDSRGAGRTDKPDEPYSIEMMAQDTIELLDKLGIRRTHVVGASLGSRIALEIAAKHPERVNGLVLVVAAARSPHIDNPQTAILFDQLREQLKIPGVIENLGKYPPTVKSILQQLDALMAYDGRSLMSQVKAPTLIVNGTKDVSVPLKLAHELADGIPGSKLILVDGDHFFIATRPEWLMDPMLEFLAEVDAKLVNNALTPVT